MSLTATAKRPAGKKEADQIRSTPEFRLAMSEGRRFVGRRMVLYVLPRQGRVRAGFVSGRRIGGAVVRNRARRRMKEAWRSLSPMASPGFDLVFTARPEIARADWLELTEEMRSLLDTAGVIVG